MLTALLRALQLGFVWFQKRLTLSQNDRQCLDDCYDYLKFRKNISQTFRTEMQFERITQFCYFCEIETNTWFDVESELVDVSPGLWHRGWGGGGEVWGKHLALRQTPFIGCLYQSQLRTITISITQGEWRRQRVEHTTTFCRTLSQSQRVTSLTEPLT